MTTKEEKIIAYNDLIGAIQKLAAVDLFYFTTDFMHELERMGGSVFTDEAGKVKSYHPSNRTEKLGKIFDIARNDLPGFILSAAPANVAELMSTKKRETLLEAMLEIGLEKRLRTFVGIPAPAQEKFEPSL